MGIRKNRFTKILLWFLLVVLTLVVAFVVWYTIDTKISPPEVNEQIVNKFQREKAGQDAYKAGNNWLRKNKYGLWEMYLEGTPFEMGVANGKLTRELIYKQESAFVEKIRELVPSPSYLNFLKYFVSFFNRDIDEYILPEYKEEIYGISLSASSEFDFIGTNYERLLNYHGAHDIGHALQDLMLVGCTSFAANMGFADSSLILGRNFDFYISDDFAEDKIVCFVNPENGHKFTYITWASFIGVVSGMNEQGLTVTINAGKSDIPFKAATPISLLAREILQYAGDIDEALAIAKKRKTFVAESLLIGSASDNRAVIIEKSPSRLGVFEVDANSLVCSNHFQSDIFAAEEDNFKHKIETATSYRQERAEELIARNDTVSYLDAAKILRDINGLDDEPIGLGNEKSMAQMISHHSVIFQPEKDRIWVSTKPWQFGEYLAYHPGTVFKNPKFSYRSVCDTTLTIPSDPFLETVAFKNFLLFREKTKLVKKATLEKSQLDDDFIEAYIKLNPDYFLGYEIAGDYYKALGKPEKAIQFYRFSLTKVVEKMDQRKEINSKIDRLNNL